jgi:hypothetical protein
MVRALVIQSWCDVCAEQGLQLEASKTFTASVDEVSREVDLCPDHSVVLLEARLFLERYGQQADTRPVSQLGPRTPGPTGGPNSVQGRTCPLCGDVAPKRQAMRDHLKRAHHTTLSRLGLTSPRGRYAAKVKAELAARG